MGRGTTVKLSYNRYRPRKEDNCPYKTLLETGHCKDEHLFVDPPAIPHVVAAISLLKTSNGFLGPLFDWMDDSLPYASVSLGARMDTDKKGVRRAMESLSEIKSVNKELEKLSKCMKFIVVEAERRYKAMQLRNGFESLPDEILSHILRFASQSDDRTSLSAVILSHVCKRFRDAMLRTPDVWNEIRDDMSLDMVKACLERSKSVALDVHLTYTSFSGNSRFRQNYKDGRFIPLISTSSNRWRSLGISVSSVRETGRLSTLEGLNLPLLRTMVVDFSSSWLEDATGSSEMRIFHDWSAPSLQSLSISHFIPPMFPYPSSLRCLNIHLGHRGLGGWNLDVHALGRFFQSCPDLAEMELAIEAPQMATSPPHPTVISLPNVETASLSFLSCENTIIERLFENIHFPAVSNMTLCFRMNDKNGSSLTTKVKTILANRSIFPNVSKLKLVIRCTENAPKNGAGSVRIPFSYLENIRHLSLTVTDYSVEPLGDKVLIPPLRSFRLDSCNNIGCSWLCDFLKRLDKQGDMIGLEDLSTNGCKLMKDGIFNCASTPPKAIYGYFGAETAEPS